MNGIEYDRIQRGFGNGNYDTNHFFGYCTKHDPKGYTRIDIPTKDNEDASNGNSGDAVATV